MDTVKTEKTNAVEKFPMADLSGLRDELRQAGLDSWQIAELISSFLAARGYGVCSGDVRIIATSTELAGGSLQNMQHHLERLAFVM